MPIKLSKQLHVLLPPVFKMLLRVLIHQLLADEAAVTHLTGTKQMFAPPCPAAMTIRAKKPTCAPTYENCAHDTRAVWREQPVPLAQLNSMFVNQPCAVVFSLVTSHPTICCISFATRSFLCAIFTKHLHGWESYFDEESCISEDILRVGKTTVKPPRTKQAPLPT